MCFKRTFHLSQTLVINEISSENFSNSFDEDGDSSDWFEVYNYGDNDVQLENWGVSDDLEEPFKWIFPEVEIEADEILVVWASGKDRVEENCTPTSVWTQKANR